MDTRGNVYHPSNSCVVKVRWSMVVWGVCGGECQGEVDTRAMVYHPSTSCVAEVRWDLQGGGEGGLAWRRGAYCPNRQGIPPTISLRGEGALGHLEGRVRDMKCVFVWRVGGAHTVPAVIAHPEAPPSASPPAAYLPACLPAPMTQAVPRPCLPP